MSFLSRVQSGAKHIDVRHGRGFWGHTYETGEYLGASYLAARFNTQYPQHAKWRGVQVTYGAGIVGKLLAVLGDVLGWNVPGSAHLNTISNALLGAHLASIGARHGSEARALPAPRTAALPPRVTGIGAIPPAQEPNRWLDLNAVDRIANMHG